MGGGGGGGGWEEGERRERNKQKRQPGPTGAGQRGEWQLNEQREEINTNVEGREENTDVEESKERKSESYVRTDTVDWRLRWFGCFVLRRFVLAASSACLLQWYEETQHVFNAALILRGAIQSLQPITPFPAEPADLSEEKIGLNVPSELYNFFSRIMTGKLSSGQSTLSEQES